MKKRYYFIIGLFIILFILMTYLVVSNKTTNFDTTIYNYLFSMRNNFLDIFFKSVTVFANTLTIIILVIILLLLINDRSRYTLGITTIVTVLSNQGLKYLIKRIRPDHLRLIKQGGYSYPSGHSMISIAVYGFLIYYVYKHIENKYLKIFLILILTLLIISIGLSRIYLGVHYPSDVIGGYLLAFPILILVVKEVEKYD